jgi:hypothetical protein
MKTADIKQYRRDYYQNNKERIDERTKKYIEDNKAQIKNYQKAYHKNYYFLNKDKLSKKAKERYRLKKYPYLVKINN